MRVKGGEMAEQTARSLNMAGEWWQPDKYEDRMMGTLTWKPIVGCLLRLVDDSYEFKRESSPGIIVGLNSDQDPVTLVGCRHARQLVEGKLGADGGVVAVAAADDVDALDGDAGLEVEGVARGGIEGSGDGADEVGQGVDLLVHG